MDAAQSNEFLAVAQPYILAAIGMALAFLFRLASLAKAKFDAWADAQISKIESDVARDAIQATKEEAEDIVLELSQTMVPEIRAAAADGKITPEERTKLQETALAHLKKRTDLATLAAALDGRGFPVDELDDWLIAQIESRVGKMNILGGAAQGDAKE